MYHVLRQGGQREWVGGWLHTGDVWGMCGSLLSQGCQRSVWLHTGDVFIGAAWMACLQDPITMRCNFSKWCGSSGAVQRRLCPAAFSYTQSHGHTCTPERTQAWLCGVTGPPCDPVQHAHDKNGPAQVLMSVQSAECNTMPIMWKYEMFDSIKAAAHAMF